MNARKEGLSEERGQLRERIKREKHFDVRYIPAKREKIVSARKAGYQGEATNGAVSRGPAQGWRTRGRLRVVRGVVCKL